MAHAIGRSRPATFFRASTGGQSGPQRWRAFSRPHGATADLELPPSQWQKSSNSPRGFDED